jgi:hypothetical protein
MSLTHPRNRLVAFFLAAGIVFPCLTPLRGDAAQYGRLAGTVTDEQGNPLIGASILVVGPALPDSRNTKDAVERVITDAHGRFRVEHLAPGWYSLKATSVTRLPSHKDGVRVEPNQTAQQNFVLSDIFAPVRFQVPQGSITSWGEDWKWVLRTSGSTRPVLRYRTTPPSKDEKASQPPDQRLIGMVTGAGGTDPLSTDPGMGSVLAYLRPLSTDADVLVAGSLAANGVQAGSLAAVFRSSILNGDPQEIALVVHQLSFSEGLPLPPGNVGDGLNSAQGIMLSYTKTRRLSGKLTLTTGAEIDYLNSARDTATARPQLRLQYQARPSTEVSFTYGAIGLESGGTLLDRVGELNAFPRVTLRGYRPQLEESIHGEVSVEHHLTKRAKVEAAAYQDSFENSALWAFGDAGTLKWLAGSLLPNPAGNGWTLNAGSYHSSGFRVGYSQQLGDHVEAEAMYSTGDALAVNPAASPAGNPSTVRGLLRNAHTDTVGAKVSARVPVTKTRVTTSYGWLPGGRATSVDPYGQASFQVRPYLGLEIRQPLPTIAFLPAHIEALADFRNMLAQGDVSTARTGEASLILTPAYRCFRGGFSVQF